MAFTKLCDLGCGQGGDQINRGELFQLVRRIPVEKQCDVTGVTADGERGEVLAGQSAGEFRRPG